MRRGASGCLCMCAWVCLRARVCRASGCLMSWEAGHRRKTVMVSCWGVVSTLWWPCFRTHTYTHKEVDGGQGGVWKEEDGVRTEDNKRRRRSSYFFFFFSGTFTLLEWTRHRHHRRRRRCCWWDRARSLSNRWSSKLGSGQKDTLELKWSHWLNCWERDLHY